MSIDLRAELLACAADLGEIITAQKARWTERRGYDSDLTIWQALDAQGRPLLVDALAARAQILIALSHLENPDG